jgi:hypothetical protein
VAEWGNLTVKNTMIEVEVFGYISREQYDTPPKNIRDFNFQKFVLPQYVTDFRDTTRTIQRNNKHIRMAVHHGLYTASMFFVFPIDDVDLKHLLGTIETDSSPLNVYDAIQNCCYGIEHYSDNRKDG